MTPELLARHADARLPRYTSYPTAPHFVPAINGDAYGGWLRDLSEDVELSLYVHVPFCAELCLYCGCQTSVARSYGPIAAYVDLLEREIELVAEWLGRRRGVSHLHWGGGTPTMLRGFDWRRIHRLMRERFAFTSDAELAVEIDPRTLTPAHVEVMAEVGVNRASLGVQSFDPAVQRAIGRVQSFEETRRVAEWLRFAGIEALNLDLMYGLPHQTAANVVETVDRALALDPDRIALFGYAHVPWMKRHQALLPEKALPDSEERVAQARSAAARIEGASYLRIGLDHFAKADDPMAHALRSGRLRRNFQGYTTDAAPVLIGFGASSISRLPQGYAQNAAGVPAYRAALQAGRLPTSRGVLLTAEDRLRGEIIERLMCDLAVDIGEVCARHGVEPSRFDAELMQVDALQREGLARRMGHRVQVEPAAREVVRLLAAVFDTGLGGSSVAMRHSQAV